MHVATTDKGEFYAISSVLNFLSYAHNDVALINFIRNVEGGEATCGKSENAGRKVVLYVRIC